MSAVGRQQNLPDTPCQQCNTVDAEWETRDDPDLNWVKLGSTCVKDCHTSVQLHIPYQ